MLSYSKNQIHLSEAFTECSELFKEQRPEFLQLLDKYIDISSFISYEFKNKFYSDMGRPRDYSLSGLISALVLRNIFKIPDDPLLILILTYSKEIAQFCGLSKVPDKTVLSKFRSAFADDLEKLFISLVDFTEPICEAIDPVLAKILSYDTTAFESFVAENNPKFLNSEIRKVKNYYKFKKLDKSTADVYKQAYANMPKTSAADSSIRKMYANGHFCYGRKYGIITNGLGIPRHIASLDEDFKNKYPDAIITDDSDSPENDKTVSDSKSLIPVLTDFYSLHPDFKHDDFLGDAAFDNVATYDFLLAKDSDGKSRFNRAFIPLNSRATNPDLAKCDINENGIPLCPNDKSLQMAYQGICKEKNRATRIKWMCPKLHRKGNSSTCNCDNPCSNSKLGRTTYTTLDNNLRLYPGILRNSPDWDSLYKIRGTIEQAINHIKTNMCVASRKTRNSKTTKADVFLAGIAQLFTVIIADRMSKYQYIRSLKPLAC